MAERLTATTRSEAWARLDAGWHRDPVLRAAAEIEPACMTLWPILVAEAKAESHVDRNPLGVVRATTRQLADLAVVDPERVTRALELLVEGEFITCDRGRLGTVSIALVEFSKWQTPRRSKGERDERSRYGPDGSRTPRMDPQQYRSDKAQDEAAPEGVCRENHPQWRRSGDGLATQDERRETGRDRSPSGDPSETPTEQPPSELVQEVFDRWAAGEERTGGLKGPRLTKGRRDKIRARLKEGYSVDQLKQAVDGYHSSPFHLGTNDRGGRYTDLTLICRSGEYVEQGIQLAAQPAGFDYAAYN